MRKRSPSSTTAMRRTRRWVSRSTSQTSPTGTRIQLYHQRGPGRPQRQKGARGQLRPRRRSLLPHPHVEARPPTPGLDFNPDGIAYCRKRHIPARPGFCARRRREPAVPGRILRRGDQCRSLARLSAALPVPRRSGTRPDARADISSTLISAAATNFPAGRPHWPTLRCANFRHASSTRRAALAGQSLAAVTGADRSPAAGVFPALRPPFRRRARYRDLPRHTKAEGGVPDVPLHQGLSGVPGSGVRLSRSPTTGIAPVP